MRSRLQERSSRREAPRPLPALGLALGLVAAAVGGGGVPAGAQQAGAVYVMTNDSRANEIVVFDRDADGRLRQSGRAATGGRGSGGDIDPLTSQGAVILTGDGRWLLAVNARSRTISRFAVEADGLELAQTVRSWGPFPVSLTQHGDRVYVLNAGGRPSIQGFSLREDGRLARLRGSKRFLGSDVAPSGRAEQPIQVEFSPDGSWLVVTDVTTDEIHLFAVEPDGRPAAAAVRSASVGAGPFGFAFSRWGHLLVSELFGSNPGGSANSGAVSSYRVAADGNLEVLSASVENFQAATCWLVTDGRRSAFTSNTASGTLTGYRVRRNGRIRRRGGNGVAFRFGGDPGALPIDLAVTADGRFLYSLNTGRGTVGMFVVRPNGRFNVLGEAGSLPARAGLQGIAAR